MESSANIQVPIMFASNADRAFRNDLVMGKDPSACFVTPVPEIVFPTTLRLLNPVVLRPCINFGLEKKLGMNK